MTRPRLNPLAIVLRWFAVLGWAGFIWWLMTLPEEEIPDVGSVLVGDKLGHAAVFCVLGLLICWAVDRSGFGVSGSGVGRPKLQTPGPRPQTPKPGSRRRIRVGLICVLTATFYAIMSEVYQTSIGRDGDVLDALADIIGAIAAYYLYFSPKLKTLLSRLRNAE